MQKWRYIIIVFYVSICITCSILTESLTVSFIMHNLDVWHPTVHDVSTVLIFHLFSPFSDHVFFFFFCEPQGMVSYRRQNMLSVNTCIFLILSLKSCIDLNKPCGFRYPIGTVLHLHTDWYVQSLPLTLPTSWSLIILSCYFLLLLLIPITYLCSCFSA